MVPGGMKVVVDVTITKESVGNLWAVAIEEDITNSLKWLLEDDELEVNVTVVKEEA